MNERRQLTGLIIAFLALTAVLIYSGQPLITNAAPLGIVSFQLAFTEGRAAAILDSWDSDAHNPAARNLLWDYPYLVVYTWILSLLCGAAGAVFKPPISRIGALLSRYVWLAALFDAVENFALHYQLTNRTSTAAASLAGITACTKFFIIVMALVYLFAAGTSIWFRR